jgi:hypothetical protein
MEIIYNPPKKIVLHEIYHFKTIEELVKTRTSNDGTRNLFWANGLLFVMYLSNSDKSKDQELDGIINIQFFDYVEMDEYKEIIEFEDNFLKLVKARVFNYGFIPFFMELTQWIKNNESKKLWE